MMEEPINISLGDKVRVRDGREGIAIAYAPWNKADHFLVRFKGMQMPNEWFTRDEIQKVGDK